ncbi:hypothetical protein L873DRAFT_1210555 [Choiromyces venosus 120613-1]|uniref:Uncharacterized protein n=1 Tax=Choiromyces venosus 120613-1 TaxID=1336337 RepID=A0A3N4JJW1_9PEZI|nr:hypothetical protein L873DRAFT_1210555 [Choiromyces venosus 120613-1]
MSILAMPWALFVVEYCTSKLKTGLSDLRLPRYIFTSHNTALATCGGMRNKWTGVYTYISNVPTYDSNCPEALNSAISTSHDPWAFVPRSQSRNVGLTSGYPDKALWRVLALSYRETQYLLAYPPRISE